MAAHSRILEHVIDPRRGDLSQELARYILSLDFPQADHARYAELAAKAQECTLSPDEQSDLDEFLSINDFLTIIQAKARASLAAQSNPAA